MLASAGELPAFRQLDLPANPAGRPGSAAAGAAKDSGGSPQHRVVYVARKILVQVRRPLRALSHGPCVMVSLPCTVHDAVVYVMLRERLEPGVLYLDTCF